MSFLRVSSGRLMVRETKGSSVSNAGWLLLVITVTELWWHTDQKSSDPGCWRFWLYTSKHHTKPYCYYRRRVCCAKWQLPPHCQQLVYTTELHIHVTYARKLKLERNCWVKSLSSHKSHKLIFPRIYVSFKILNPKWIINPWRQSQIELETSVWGRRICWKTRQWRTQTFFWKVVLRSKCFTFDFCNYLA